MAEKIYTQNFLNTLLKVTRVSYGRKSTPVDKREYRIDGASAVGFISDWEKLAKENNLKGLLIVEKDEPERVLLFEVE